MIDTHTHIYYAPLEEGCAMVERAREAGVEHLVFPNVDLDSITQMEALQAKYGPERISLAMGLHPTEVKPETMQHALELVTGLLTQNPERYVAVGEVGMDLYWDKTYEKEQAEALEKQCSLARDLGLPVIIHCREALPQTLEVLRNFSGLPVVFHSFGGTVEDVRAIRRVLPEAYFGINGIVTFKNSGLAEVPPEIGVDKLLLETDSPYLAPVPKRGKKNESSYLPYILERVAHALGISPKEADLRTTANARRLFSRLPQESSNQKS